MPIKYFVKKLFVVFCSFSQYYISVKEELTTIFDIDHGTAPVNTSWTVQINTDSQQVKAFARHSKVNCYDILSFSHKLTRWSQIDAIISRVKYSPVAAEDDIKHLLKDLENCYGDVSTEMQFHVEQMQLQLVPTHGRRYSTSLFRQALEIYLSSRTTYRILRNFLSLPHPRTLVSKIGNLGDVGSEDECTNIIRSVLPNLTTSEKRFILMFDEMYVKPSIRFRGGHIIGYSEDKPDEIAKTILVLMLKPMFGKPAFVCRMIPTFKLSVCTLENAIRNVVKQVHEEGGIVFCLMCDNHPTNRAVYSNFRVDGLPPWKGSVYSGHEVFLLNDPVHLFKSIRNNWMTERNGVISMNFRGHCFTGKWREIIELYDCEKTNVIKMTKLSYKAVHPSSVERQKATLMTDVFNEKTVAALRTKDFATSEFLDVLVTVWNLVNVKSRDAHTRLHDSNRMPFSSVDDDRLAYITDFAVAINEMLGGKGSNRRNSLTSETKTAVVNSFNGLTDVIKQLLSEDHSYVLPGIFQSDRLEGEFGIYRLDTFPFS